MPESREHGLYPRKGHGQQGDVARTRRWHLFRPLLRNRKAGSVADEPALVAGNFIGNLGHGREDLSLLKRAAFGQIDRRQPARRRGDADPKIAAAGREEAPAHQFCGAGRAHAVQNRQEGLLHEVERRRQGVMGAALQADRRRPRRQQERRKNRLQHEHGTAGSADREVIRPRNHCSRSELERGGGNSGPAHRGLADGLGRPDRREMLAHQTRLLA